MSRALMLDVLLCVFMKMKSNLVKQGLIFIISPSTQDPIRILASINSPL